MTFIRKLPNLEPEMRGALKNHIIRKRQRLRQELEQEAIEKRLKREKELKRVQDAMTLDQIKEQLSNLERKLESLKSEKHHLFVQLKQLLSEDNTRRKQLEDTQQQQTLSSEQQSNKLPNNTEEKQSTNLGPQELITPPQPIRPPILAPMTNSSNPINPMVNHSPITANHSNVLRQQAINHINPQEQTMFPQNLTRHPIFNGPRTSTQHLDQINMSNMADNPNPLTVATSYPDLSSYLRVQQANQAIRTTNTLPSQTYHGLPFGDHPSPHYMSAQQLDFALQHRLQIPTAIGHKPVPSHMDTPLSLTASNSSSPYNASQMLSGKRCLSDTNLNGDFPEARNQSRKKHNNQIYPPASRYQMESLPTGMPTLAQLGLLNHNPPTSSLAPSFRQLGQPALIDHPNLPRIQTSSSSPMMHLPRSLHSSTLPTSYEQFSSMNAANTSRPGLMLPMLNSFQPNNGLPPPTPSHIAPHSHQSHLLPQASIPHTLYSGNGLVVDMKNYPFHNIPPHMAARFNLPPGPLHEQNSRYLSAVNIGHHNQAKLPKHKNQPK